MEKRIDFSRITACGECCDGCAKKRSGDCPGCIQADGRVPEWAQSGECRVHACARAHEARFCGVCGMFPCDRMEEMMPWKTDVAEHMRALCRAMREQEEPYADGLRAKQADS